MAARLHTQKTRRYWPPAEWSIQIKLLVSVVSVVFLALIATGLLNGVRLTQELSDTIGAQFEELASSQMNYVADILSEQIALVRGISLVDNIQFQVGVENTKYTGDHAAIDAKLMALEETWQEIEDDQASLVQKIIDPWRNRITLQLVDYQNNFPDLLEIMVTDRYGAVIAATRRPEHYYHGHFDWWQDVYNAGSGNLYLGNPFADDDEAYSSLIAAVPLYDSTGAVVGVVRSVFDLESVNRAIEQLQFDQTGRAVLATREGIILAQNGLGMTGDSLPPDWYSPVNLAAGNGSTQSVNLADDPIVLGYATIDNAVVKSPLTQEVFQNVDWILYVYQSQSEAYTPVVNVRRVAIFTTIIFSVFAAFVSLMIARTIISPVEDLVTAARQFAAGEMRARARVTRYDEIGEMAGVFNMMADRVVQLLEDLEQRVKARTRGLMTAADVSQVTTGVFDIETLIQQVVDLTRNRLGLYYIGIFLLDETRRFAILRAGTGEAGQQMMAEGHRLEVGGTSMIGQCTAQNRPLIANDVRREEIHFRNPHLPATRSELALPLRSRGEVIGAMTVQSVQPDAFGDEETAVLQTIADQAAGAIRGAQLFARTQEALRQTEAALAEAKAAEQRLMREAWEAYPETGEVMYYETEPLDASVMTEIEQAMAHQQRLVVSDDQNGQSNHAALVSSITVAGVPVGALGVHADRSREWTEEDVSLFEAVIERLALAVENRRLDEQTQRALAENEALYAGSDRVVRAATIQEVLEALVVSTALQRFDRASIFLFEKPWGERRPESMTLEAEWVNEGRVSPSVIGVQIELARFPALDLLRPDTSFFAADVTTDKRVSDEARAYLSGDLGMRSVVYFPIVVNEQWIGLVSGQAAEMLSLSETEERRIVSLTDQAGTVIENRRLFQRTQATLQETSALYDTSALINRATSLDEVLHAMISGIELPGVARAAIWLYDRVWEDEEDLPEYQEIVAAWDLRTDNPIIVVGRQTSLVRFPVLGYLRRDVPFTVDDLENPPAFIESATVDYLEETFQARAMAFVPLVAGEQWIGNFQVCLNRPAVFGDTLTRRLTALAGQAAVAIEAIRRLKLTQESLQETESLYRASARINTATTLDEVLDAMLAGVEMPFASRAMIALFDRPWVGKDMPDYFEAVAAWDERVENAVLSAGMRFDMAQSVISLLLEPDKPLAIGDVDADPRLDDATRVQYKEFFRAQSVIFVPLVAAGQWIGTFTLIMREAFEFDEAYQRRIMTLAGQAAVAIQAINRLQQTRSALEETRSLYDGSARINASERAQEILEALRQSTLLGQANVASILLFERPWQGDNRPEAGLVLAEWSDQESAEIFQLDESFRLENFPGILLLRPDEPLVVEDVAEEVRLDDRSRALASQANIQSAAIIPMVAGGQWIGAVIAAMREATSIPEAGVRRLMALTRQAAVALQSQLRFQETQEALQEAQALYQFTEIVSDALEARTVYDAIVMALLDEVRYFNVWIATLDEEEQMLQGVAGAGGNMTPELVNLSVPLSEAHDPAVDAVQDRRSITINNVAEDERASGLHPMIRAFADKLISAPIFVGSNVVGAVVATRPFDAPDITRRDAQLFQAIVTQASVAIQRAQLFEQTQATLAETRALYDGSARINAAESFDGILDAIRFGTLFGQLNMGGMVLFEQPSLDDRVPRQAISVATWGVEDVPVFGAPSRSMDLSEHPFARFLSREESVYVSDVLSDPRLDEEARGFYRRIGARSVIFTPLVAGGQWIGYITAFADRVTEYDTGDLRRLMTIGSQAAIATQSLLRQQETADVLQETSVLYEASQGLVTAADNEGLLDAVADYGLSAGAHLVLLIYFELDEAGRPERAHVVAQRGREERNSVGSRFTLADYPFADLWFEDPDNPIIIPDVTRDPRMGQDALEHVLKQNAQALVILPLRSGGRWIGVIIYSWPEVQSFTERDDRIYRTLRDQAAVAIDSRRLQQETEARALRERTLRQITARVRGATDPDAIVRAAVRELGAALDRPAFVRLGDTSSLSRPSDRSDGKDDDQNKERQVQRRGGE